MTEDKINSLATLSVKIDDLMKFCDLQKAKIANLNDELEEKKRELKRANAEINELNTKFNHLLTAKIITSEEGDIKSAQNRLTKLVREIDKCIALLNE